MTSRRILTILAALFLGLFSILPSYAQTETDPFITVTGIVRDADIRLPYVNVSILDSTLGTVTNEDGYFSLKIPVTDDNFTIEVSHVGYYATRKTVSPSQAQGLVFTLKPHPNLLDYASIISYDPQTLVAEALGRIRKNYPTAPVLQRGFYRETAQKGNRYISIAEAVLDLAKSSYLKDVAGDRVRLIKGRRLVSQKSADTLSVKLEGGPTLAVNMDQVKNKFDLFYERDLDDYQYSFLESTVIEQRPQFVVSMKPLSRNEEYPLYNAKVYIDKETLSIMRIEYSLDMYDINMVTNLFLKKKPANLRFQPLEISYVVGYRTMDDLTVLNYVRATMRFKCDWKKRLFSSAYTVTSEMVSTDIRFNSQESITYKESFRERDIFYDRVTDFQDPDFWGAYNILEPSESLEHAVSRLRRRAR